MIHINATFRTTVVEESPYDKTGSKWALKSDSGLGYSVPLNSRENAATGFVNVYGHGHCERGHALLQMNSGFCLRK